LFTAENAKGAEMIKKIIYFFSALSVSSGVNRYSKDLGDCLAPRTKEPEKAKRIIVFLIL
jgi:hypothetical protein